jgi:hypothetical protein
MKVYGGVDVQIHIYLKSALAGGEQSASHPCCFTSRERAPCSHWIGGWVNPRAGLDEVQKRKFLTLPGLKLQPLGCPAYSQSLYCLSRLLSFEYKRNSFKVEGSPLVNGEHPK